MCSWIDILDLFRNPARTLRRVQDDPSRRNLMVAPQGERSLCARGEESVGRLEPFERKIITSGY